MDDKDSLRKLLDNHVRASRPTINLKMDVKVEKTTVQSKDNKVPVKKERYSAEEKKERQQDKDGRTVFVGNLSSSTERKHLRQHFKVCGQIESVRLRGLVPSKMSVPKKVAAIK